VFATALPLMLAIIALEKTAIFAAPPFSEPPTDFATPRNNSPAPDWSRTAPNRTNRYT